MYRCFLNFQNASPETQKLRGPNVMINVRGTTRSPRAVKIRTSCSPSSSFDCPGRPRGFSNINHDIWTTKFLCFRRCILEIKETTVHPGNPYYTNILNFRISTSLKSSMNVRSRRVLYNNKIPRPSSLHIQWLKTVMWADVVNASQRKQRNIRGTHTKQIF